MVRSAIIDENILASEAGIPEYNRRLTDKVLAAFNHAYATGAREIADQLRGVLTNVDRKERALHKERQQTAVGQADLWIEFVETRDAYNAALADQEGQAKALEGALEDMRRAHQRWSDS